MPRSFNSAWTSLYVLERPLIVYLLVLSLNAVRETTRLEFGTTSKASGPGLDP